MPKGIPGSRVVRPKKKIGRPAMFNEALAVEVCERIAQSDVGLIHVCKADDMPSATTVKKWLRENENFATLYARAKAEQGMHQGERAVQAAIEAEDPAKGRLLFDAFRWSAAKLAPKVYGEVAQMRLLNADGTGDARIEVVTLADELAGLLNITPKAENPALEAPPKPKG